MYLALKRHDLSKFNICSRPITENYLNMKKNQLSIIYFFLKFIIIKMDKDGDLILEWSGSDFFKLFLNWKNNFDHIKKYEYTLNKFAREVTIDFKCIKKKNNKERN